MNRLFIVFAFLLTSCGSGVATKGGVKVDSTTKVGGDRDSHGCIASAGYVWSEVRGECIRLWETGIILLPVDNSDQVSYALFGRDSLKVEVFLPNSKNIILDRRSTPSGKYVWNVEDDDTFNLEKSNNYWQLTRRGIVLYKQK